MSHVAGAKRQRELLRMYGEMTLNKTVDCNTFVRVCRKFRFYTFEVPPPPFVLIGHAVSPSRSTPSPLLLPFPLPTLPLRANAPSREQLYTTLKQLYTTLKQLYTTYTSLPAPPAQVGPAKRVADPAARPVFEALAREWGKVPGPPRGGWSRLCAQPEAIRRTHVHSKG
mgnify:CR=1 FL=1